MMIHFLGRERDPRHESECLCEILEFEHAVQVSVQHAPSAEIPQLCCNFLLRKSCRCHEGLPRFVEWALSFRTANRARTGGRVILTPVIVVVCSENCSHSCA